MRHLPEDFDGPEALAVATGELFRTCLDESLNLKHPLIRLAALID